MVIGDGAYIKKINRSLILQKIIEHQQISRANLSKITGLNKATISVQVSDLLDEDLIYETRPEHNSVGRRPILLSINQTAGYLLGVDFDYKNIQFTVADLIGNFVENNTINFDTEDYNEATSLLKEQIQSYQTKYAFSRYGLISCVIGIHGTVGKDEEINFIPKYQWSKVNLKKDLQNELDIHLIIENNANLSAFAEKVFHHPHNHNQSSHLLSIMLSSGIGAGRMIDWDMDKGCHGYTGEMGHMIISPFGPRCKCGNNGCWELYASEPILFNKLSEQLNKPHITHRDIKQLINKKDPVTHELFHEYIFYVAIGLNNVINLYNPGTVVLNSRVLKAYPNAIQKIKENMTSNVSQYDNIVLSELGRKACVIGACALGIQHFLGVSELFLSHHK
ncbi:xylose repressor [Lentibacillus kapialis]|uniref:Xylose repressor n=1 Tax=Lentibacillus kapialis TaxID=340214 RepID=A0A917UV95_9BACI|nr:ROK family transcriptional regulator [Lentibacillus kapialis]GGJ87737.1 xylose repressor [Lentibacillus kapialis]